MLKLRVSDEEEILGLDDVEIGEFAVSLSIYHLSVYLPDHLRVFFFYFLTIGLLADGCAK